MEKEPSNTQESKKTNQAKTRSSKKIILWILVAIIALPILYVLNLYASSPSAIRQPKFEHAHFRLQLVVDGQEVNFGEEKFQEPYKPGVCSQEITEKPIHFHDNKNQFVHIHWKNITGGMVLKYYGWNYNGGISDALGYRFDDLPNLKKVPIHGDVLPEMPEGSKLWIYSGDKNSFEIRAENDFINKSLEEFFGVESLIKSEELSWQNLFASKANAHGTEHQTETNDQEYSEDELKKINNLLGNVVIFAQKEEPSQEEIQERFDNLSPLSSSTCGG